MMITVSGMVGSGKSTVAKHIVQVLKSSGVSAHHVRFRSVGWMGARSEERPRPVQSGPTDAPLRGRWSGFQLRTLTAKVAVGYMARIMIFRMTGAAGASSDCVVFDRYFYDSFVHYALVTRRERCYASLIQRTLPVPDVSFLLMASSATLMRRRPEYAPEYVTVVERQYQQLLTRFPELVEIRTDSGEPTLERVEALVRTRISPC